MIFISKNEKGIPAWKLIMQGKKTVTRRLKPEPVGAIRAVCPGRGKEAVCYIKIISCMTHLQWRKKEVDGFSSTYILQRYAIETKREGFDEWCSLIEWFQSHKIKINDTYRIEFKVVKKSV